MLLHEGKNYARVSDVLRPFADFTNIDPLVLEAKASLGTEVHKIIEDYIRGQRTLSLGKAHGYYSSWLKWAGSLCPDFVHSEKRYFCDKKMITGQIDALVKIQDIPALILCDWKTSAAESPTWEMQAHLYRYLADESGLTLADYALFLKLDKAGKAPKVYTYRYNQNTHAKCMLAIEEYWKSQEKA